MNAAQTPAAMKLLRRLADNPLTQTAENERIATPVQKLLEARLVSAYGVEEGWRWIIHEAGWKALGADAETIRTKLAEQRAFAWAWRQAIEARHGTPAQADLFGRAA